MEQSFTINAPENNVIDGVERVTINGSITSGDKDYNNIKFPEKVVEFLDNDLPTVGTISGSVWFDSNADGLRDTGELATDVGTIFIDLNKNGLRESEEPSHPINTDGSFSFHNLVPAKYLIGIELPFGYFPTHPNGSQSSVVYLEETSVSASFSISGSDEVYHDKYTQLISSKNIFGEYGYDGSGQTVVVIDTGIELNHSFFGKDENGDGVSDRIIFEKDFTNENDNTANDQNGHGTHVAGIIAGASETLPGIAPGANLIALQALTASGSGGAAGLEDALSWCIENAEKYNISVINMSLGFPTNETEPLEWFLTDELLALKQLGVSTVSASGNDYQYYQTAGVAYPSSDPYSMSVGAVFHSDVGRAHGANSSTADQIAAFSQRDPDQTTIFAPGVYMPASWINGSTKSISGTSMAAPVIAGAIAVMQEASETILGRRLLVDEVEQILRENSDTIFDGDDEDDNLVHTEAQYPRLNMEETIKAIEFLKQPGVHAVDLKAGDTFEGNFGIALSGETASMQIDESSGLKVIGGSASDYIIGSNNSDNIHGGAGNDAIFSNGGADNIYTGSGNDVAVISGEGTLVSTGSGQDEIFLSSDARNITITDFDTVNAGVELVKKFIGTEGDDILYSITEGIELISGGAGDDTIYGFSQSDLLVGGAGQDTIFGGEGDDLIIASAGADLIEGGYGNDLFVFDANSVFSNSSNTHIINDFELDRDTLAVFDSEFFEMPAFDEINGELFLNYRGNALVELEGYSMEQVNSLEIAILSNSQIYELETTYNIDFV